MSLAWVGVILILASAPALAQEKAQFLADPNSPELQALAQPLAVDVSKYGCGPLQRPGKTYYVSMRGDDGREGTSWSAAWRTLRHALGQLKAGDTLVIGEGLYIEPSLTMNAEGEPRRPITITAAPRHRVIISGGQRPPLRKTPGAQFTYVAEFEMPKGEGAAWEADTQILLQRVVGMEMVDELPGTFAYDEKERKIYVHFSDSRGPEVHALAVCPGRLTISSFTGRDACGLDVRGAYVRLKGLSFMNYPTAMVIRGDSEDKKTYRGGHHITVEECSFSSTCFAGLVLYAGARWNLIRSNYGAWNGDRGSILVNHSDAQDNLIVGNWLDPSTPTIREGGWDYGYGISTYGTVGPRNHILRNVMVGPLSFRTKFMFKETVLEGNIMGGSCSTVPTTYYELKYRPEERIIFRNNVFLGPVTTHYQAMHPSGPGGNWCDEFKAFVNNFALDAKNQAQQIEAARFADPAYVDFRLQSDSPLRGSALGGGDVGAFRQPTGRVLYVDGGGSDDNSGTSIRLALRTLPKAASLLEPGDTLYIMPGTYAEPLVIEHSGKQDAPITVRAYSKKEVVLPSIHASGSWLSLENFAVSNQEGDGVTVRGSDVTLKRCVIHGCGRAGVRAQGARALSIQYCTLVGNGIGLVLENGCAETSVRDSVIALNRDAAMRILPDSAEGYLASHNCYFGPGLPTASISAEVGSVVGDPKFVDTAKKDYRLQWDSPAAHRDPYGQPVGALPALPRTPEIEAVSVEGVDADSAVVTWRTPKDDTTGAVQWREKGAKTWRSEPRLKLGTVHGVGLQGLKPATEYEFQVKAKSAQGHEVLSNIQTFKTLDAARKPSTYFVSSTGDDRADGRTEQTAWKTLRRASFAVGPGDTVLIAPGVYHHPITPLRGGTADRRIAFRRMGQDVVIVDGQGVLAPLVQFSRRNWVTVEGLIFDNLPPAGHDGVINVAESEGFELLNCRVGYKKRHGGFGNGINLHACRRARIEGNLIWGTRYHCVLNGCTDTIVKNNTFTWGQVFSVHLIPKLDGIRLVNNIFYYPTSVPNAAVAICHPSKEIPLTSDYNLFGPMVEGTRVAYIYKEDFTKLLVAGPTLIDWQRSTGHDQHSLQADPKFVNPTAGDFRLQPDSPAIGAGEGGANIGACGVARIKIEGRTNLFPGEGRTLRLEGRWIGPATGQVVFEWSLPEGQKRQGAMLEYTPPPSLNCFKIKLTATNGKGEVATLETYLSVPPPEIAQMKGPAIKIEAEDFVDQGGGKVSLHADHVNVSGKSVTRWYESIGQWLEWEFQAPSDGEYVFFARYATALEERSRRLTLNGQCPSPEYEKIIFPCTGGWSINEDNWAFKQLGPPVRLKAGKHRLRMENLNSAINLDYIIVVVAK